MEGSLVYRRGVRAGDSVGRHERESPAARRLSLLDTSILIDALRDDPRASAVVADAVAGGAAASELTRYEILVGARPDEEDATETLFAQLDWIVVSEDIARLGAALAQQFRRGFSGIEDADFLIAATALELGSSLLTSNVRRFPMFPGLEAAY